MVMLNITTVLILLVGCYAAGLVTPAAWWLGRRFKRHQKGTTE